MLCSVSSVNIYLSDPKDGHHHTSFIHYFVANQVIMSNSKRLITSDDNDQKIE